jgi:hypothetical protein
MPHKAALIMPEFTKSNETIDCRLPNNMQENIRQGEPPTPFHSIDVVIIPQGYGECKTKTEPSPFFFTLPRREAFR